MYFNNERHIDWHIFLDKIGLNEISKVCVRNCCWCCFVHEMLRILSVENMGKKDGKPRGKMTAYAYFVQTCRDELKKKNPNESVVFSEFAKKCGEKWKVSEICLLVIIGIVIS